MGLPCVIHPLLANGGPSPHLIEHRTERVPAHRWPALLEPGYGYADGLLGPLVLVGLVLGLSFMPPNATILSAVTPRQTGAASGLPQTLQWLGSAVGLPALVTVYGTATRHTTGSPDAVLTHGPAHAFATGAALTLTGGRRANRPGEVSAAAASRAR
ncbi:MULTISPECIES: MFS transporter [Streptomyces]|uniref:MFS transporter n=1 Tax=Streptomyces eurythermus TaxID=42237 RepID=A0ABW6YV62_9ACTN